MSLTVEQFTQRVTSSGVLPEDQLREWLAGLPADAPARTDGEALARELVKQKRLTKFQAEQIYAGKGSSLTLGNYVILDKLGQGGMGMVLKARHRRMERTVAIKVIAPKVVKEPMALKRFQREVVAAAKLSHPNIVAAHDADEAKGTHFLVMEYVEGSDLSSWVKQFGPMPVERAVSCIVQAACGLAYAHEQGVVHRDIKPHNLLMDAKGIVKILDMGLARLEGGFGGSAEHADLTNSGAMMGTVDYMSPEQAMDSKHADARSDIYSLGCTLFYLMTGHATFNEDTVMKRLTAHQHAAPPSLAEEAPTAFLTWHGGTSASSSGSSEQLTALNAVFQRMVAKKPADRFQSMSEVITALEQCRSGLGFSDGGATTADSAMRSFFQDITGGSSTSRQTASTESQRTAVLPGTDDATIVESQFAIDTESKLHETIARDAQTRKATPKKFPRRVVVAAVLAGVLLLTIGLFAMRGPTGTLHLEVSDELTKVTIGKTGRVVKGRSEQDLRLPLGEYVLHVERERLAFDTDAFEVTKDETVAIKVERVGRRVRAMMGNTLLGHKEQPSTKPAESPQSPEKSLVTIQRRAGKYEVVAPGYRAKVTSDGLLEKVEVAGATLIETTNLGGEGGKIGSNGFVTAKPEGASLVFQQARDYRLKYDFDAEGFTVRVLLNEAVAARDAVDGKAYFIFYDVYFSKEATLVRSLDGGSDFPLTTDKYQPTSRFAVAFKNGLELEVSSPPTEAGFNTFGDPYRWAHGYLAYDTDNIFRFDIRQPVATTVPQPALAIAPFNAKQARKHQEAWAKHLSTTVETTNSVGAKMILIPPGEFLMGSTPEQNAVGRKLGEADKLQPDDQYWSFLDKETPQHQVTLTRPFWMGTTEVTIGQFRKFVEATKYVTYAERYGFGNSTETALSVNAKQNVNESQKGLHWKSSGETAGDEFPVRQITWDDACAFCAWLSEQEGLTPGYRNEDRRGWAVVPQANGYRLPTEAEWEYACRAGTTTQFWYGDDVTQHAQHELYADGPGYALKPVGSKRPNPFGLFDMSGSVREWCQDFYDAKLYEQGSAVDPLGPTSGRTRIIRGGSWAGKASYLRSAFRYSTTISNRSDVGGFRVVRVTNPTGRAGE